MNDVTVPHVEFLARHIVSRAIDDEIALRGAAHMTETLACYLEFRIAEAMRTVMPDTPRKRFDA